MGEQDIIRQIRLLQWRQQQLETIVQANKFTTGRNAQQNAMPTLAPGGAGGGTVVWPGTTSSAFGASGGTGSVVRVADGATVTATNNFAVAIPSGKACIIALDINGVWWIIAADC